MEHDSSRTTTVNGHTTEEELLDEMGEQGRWTPAAFTLAVSASEETVDPATGHGVSEAAEELKARDLDSADREFGDSDDASQWTPVALRLARSESSKTPL
jgi:hypothetical protein